MIIRFFVFWRIGLFLVGFLGSRTFPKIENGGLAGNYLSSWAQWDGGHYFGIAQNGYIHPSDYAFFPLYPILTKYTSILVGGQTLLAGFLVSNLAFLAFLIVFYRYLKTRYPARTAQNSIITFLLFPTTFFAVSFYSESLFLLFAALFFTFLSARKYLLAAIATSLASLTRFVGVTLIISLFYSYLAQIDFKIKKINIYFLHLTVAAFGFMLYIIYLWSKLDDPFKFLATQSFWNRNITDPASTIISYFWAFITGEARPINDYFDLFTTLIFLAILIAGIRKIPSSLWIFSTLVILIPSSTGTLTSMPRYVLSSLGAFIIVGQYLEKKPNMRISLWAASLIAQIFLLVRFLTGYWVA